jgi:uncharacterized protein YutE (UPF0331/DUF86 family)
MVRVDVVAKKIATARARLKDAHGVFNKNLEDFLADERERDLAMFYLFLAIQECIDIAAHWVADAGWGVPEDAGETFDILGEHAVISRELARALRGAVSLRNRIGHGYISVDPERVHTEYPRGADALRRFLARAAEEIGL